MRSLKYKDVKRKEKNPILALRLVSYSNTEDR
jgi:hypothetical protein